MPTGFVHAYYGNGKGKTTAAIGLAFRASQQGLSVLYTAFLKQKDCPELCVSAPWDTLAPTCDFGFWCDLSEAERTALIQQSTCQLEEVFHRGKSFDLLVLDEALTAAHMGVIEESRLIELLRSRPEGQEVVLTGHILSPAIESIADYITEFTSRRHPYDAGVPARKGIEY